MSTPPSTKRSKGTSSSTPKVDKWFYLLDSINLTGTEVDLAQARQGPFTPNEILALWKKGDVKSNSLVWKAKQKEGWIQASDCIDFNEMIAAGGGGGSNSNLPANTNGTMSPLVESTAQKVDPAPIVSIASVQPYEPNEIAAESRSNESQPKENSNPIAAAAVLDESAPVAPVPAVVADSEPIADSAHAPAKSALTAHLIQPSTTPPAADAASISTISDAPSSAATPASPSNPASLSESMMAADSYASSFDDEPADFRTPATSFSNMPASHRTPATSVSLHHTSSTPAVNAMESIPEDPASDNPSRRNSTVSVAVASVPAVTAAEPVVPSRSASIVEPPPSAPIEEEPVPSAPAEPERRLSPPPVVTLSAAAEVERPPSAPPAEEPPPAAPAEEEPTPPPPPPSSDCLSPDDGYIPPPPPEFDSPSSKPTTVGSVAARLQNLQRLESEAKSKPVTSSSTGAAAAATASLASASSTAKSKAQLWKESFGSHEEVKKVTKTATSNAELASSPVAAATPSAASPAFQSPAPSSSPNPTLSLAERSVFASVGASTAPLISAGAALSGAAGSSQIRLPLHASSWTGSNGLQCNRSWMATGWGHRGNQLMVVPLDRFDKHMNSAGAAANSPSIAAPASHNTLINAHSNAVLDFAFAPFAQDEIASGSNESVIKFWTLPSLNEGPPSGSVNGLNLLSSPSSLLHISKPIHTEVKVHGLLYNPTASDVIATILAPLDAIHIYDLSNSRVSSAAVVKPAAIKINCEVGSPIFSACWSPTGREISCTSGDRILRIFDIRSSSPGMKTGQSCLISESGKASRVIWVEGNSTTDSFKLATLSFARDSSRLLSLWDRRNLSLPICVETIDLAQMNSPMMFYHHSQRVIIISGKGDSSVKFIELNKEKNRITYLNEYKCSAGGGSGKPHRGMAMGGTLSMVHSGPPSIGPTSPTSIATLTPDDLPNMYRLSPAVASVLPSSSADGAGAGSGFIELVRLRRSDVLHRAIVKRRLTIEAESRARGGATIGDSSSSSTANNLFPIEYPLISAEQFFAPPKQAHHAKTLGHGAVPSNNSAASAAAIHSSSGAVAVAMGPTAFDVLVSDLLPKLRDPSASAEFVTATSANLTIASQMSAAMASKQPQLKDLLHFRSLLPTLAGGNFLSTTQSIQSSSSNNATAAYERVGELEERLGEMEQLLGSASLAQKKFMATIAGLEKQLGETQNNHHQQQQSGKIKHSTNAVNASGSSIEHTMIGNHHGQQTGSSHHPPPSIASNSGISGFLSYPVEFETNLSMFIGGGGGGLDDSTRAAEIEEEVWGWTDMNSVSNSNTSLNTSAATTSANSSNSTNDPSSPPTRLLSNGALSQLLKSGIIPRVQTLLPCPRLGIGIEMGFQQMHQLIYLQSVSVMHLKLP